MPHTPLPPSNRSRARSMRKRMTDAELKLWNEVRAHRRMDLGFRRQFPIGSYVVDFACPAKRLIVEIDGSQHGEDDIARSDAVRTRFLEQRNPIPRGVTVLAARHRRRLHAYCHRRRPRRAAAGRSRCHRP